MHQGSYYDSVLAIQKKNKIPSLSSTTYDANLISVITTELKFIFFHCDVCFCVWSNQCCVVIIAVTPSVLKTSVKFWGISFKFWLRSCYLCIISSCLHCGCACFLSNKILTSMYWSLLSKFSMYFCFISEIIHPRLLVLNITLPTVDNFGIKQKWAWNICFII